MTAAMAALAALAALAAAPPAAAGDEPATLAVLPLTQGAGSDTYRGLGQALAGMLVSDLSSVSALQLVERQRLDALLDEMALAETGFIDETTAQRLGRGLGARWVLTGSYSVVGETFVLDGRVIHVDSGAIAKAASSTGTPADFVAVEKDLVQSLLDGIEVALTAAERRALVLAAPTERFDAFAAYGEGLAARDEGDAAAAAAAFERALRLDPRFAAAREALDGVRALVDAARDERRATHEDAASAAHASILAAYPDERSRPDDVTDDVESVAGLALRLMVLENEGRHCQRYEEMRHYLDRVRWQVAPPPPRPGDGAVLPIVAAEMAREHGFDRLPADLEAPEAARDAPSARTDLFRSTAAFVVGRMALRWYDADSSLVAAAGECFDAAGQLAAIDDMIEQVRSHGVAQQREFEASGGLSLEQALQLAWCRVHAAELGADAELERRTAALLRESAGDARAHATLIDQIDGVVELADRWEESSLRRMGLSEGDLIAFMDDLGARDPGRFSQDDPVCDYHLGIEAPRARAWRIRLDEAVARGASYVDDMLDEAGARYAATRDLGCLAGTPARAADVGELAAFVRAVPERLRPEKRDDAECVRALGNLELMLTPDAVRMIEDYPAQAPPVFTSIWTIYWSSVVFNRCVDEQW